MPAAANHWLPNLHEVCIIYRRGNAARIKVRAKRVQISSIGTDTHHPTEARQCKMQMQLAALFIFAARTRPASRHPQHLASLFSSSASISRAITSASSPLSFLKKETSELLTQLARGE